MCTFILIFAQYEVSDFSLCALILLQHIVVFRDEENAPLKTGGA